MFMVGHSGRELVLKTTPRNCANGCGSLFRFFEHYIVLFAAFVKLRGLAGTAEGTSPHRALCLSSRAHGHPYFNLSACMLVVQAFIII